MEIPLNAFRIAGRIVVARALGMRATFASLANGISLEGDPSPESLVTLDIAGDWAECARTGEREDAQLEGREAIYCIAAAELATGKSHTDSDEPHKWFLQRTRQAKEIISSNIEPLKTLAISLASGAALDAQAIESAFPAVT